MMAAVRPSVTEHDVRRVEADDAVSHGLRCDPGVVGPDEAGERRAGVVGVVVDEVFFGVLLEGCGVAHRGQHLRVGRRPPGVQGSDGEAAEGDREAQPADAVERRGQLQHEEGEQLLQHVGGDAGELLASAGEREREPVALQRLAGGGLDHRQLGRSRLVAVDQFVGLGTREAALFAQLGKAVPFFAVSGGVGVEVHLLK
jgi:hypothetical protein